MTTGVIVAVVGLFVVILTHTAVLFRWGGKVTTLLEQHSEELKILRIRYHDEIAPTLTRLSSALELIRDRIDRRGDAPPHWDAPERREA